MDVVKLDQVMKMSRTAILQWLARNDPNGAYLDKDVKAEYGEHARLATLDEAREEIFFTLITASIDIPEVGDKVSFEQLVAAYVRSVIDEIAVAIRMGRVPKTVRSISNIPDETIYGRANYFLLYLYGKAESAEIVKLGKIIVDIWLRVGHIDSNHMSYH